MRLCFRLMDYFGVGDNWVFNLIMNLLSYGTVLVPGYFIIKYVSVIPPGIDMLKQ